MPSRDPLRYFYPNFGAEGKYPAESTFRILERQMLASLWRTLIAPTARLAPDLFEVRCRRQGWQVAPWVAPTISSQTTDDSAIDPLTAWKNYILKPSGYSNHYNHLLTSSKLKVLLPWYPDKEAQELAQSLDAVCISPPLAVVQQLHDKAFAVRFAQNQGWQQPHPEFCSKAFAPMPHSLPPSVILDPDDLYPIDVGIERLHSLLTSWPTFWAERFTLKPRWESSGRGRVAGRRSQLHQPQLIHRLEPLARLGGAILEPWYTRREDFSSQWLILPSNGSESVRIWSIGSLTQKLAVSGHFLGHTGRFFPDGRVIADSPWTEHVQRSSAELAAAAAASHYWGFAGVDAFSYSLHDWRPEFADTVFFRPAVEWNARFTIGTLTVLTLHCLAQQLPLLQSPVNAVNPATAAAWQQLTIAATGTPFDFGWHVPPTVAQPADEGSTNPFTPQPTPAGLWVPIVVGPTQTPLGILFP